MNIIITAAVYLAFTVFEYLSGKNKMSRGEKCLYIILSILAVLSCIPASAGMDFDTVGSSLSGMISLFMH